MIEGLPERLREARLRCRYTQKFVAERIHISQSMIAGYEILNVDITIALQEPKLRPFIGIMRETLAGTMGIDKSKVSVKATTTERLGFVGRGEGCEVWATVLINGTSDINNQS